LFEGTDENHEKPVKTPVSGPRCEPSTYWVRSRRANPSAATLVVYGKL
jgi:hypothetical protein